MVYRCRQCKAMWKPGYKDMRYLIGIVRSTFFQYNLNDKISEKDCFPVCEDLEELSIVDLIKEICND